MEQQKQSSGFMNGLLIGLVLGAGLVYLLTTKRGKKILHALTEEGLDSISNMDDLYKRLEKAVKAATENISVKEEVKMPSLHHSILRNEFTGSEVKHSEQRQPFDTEESSVKETVRQAPVLLATDEVISSKLAEVKERLDQEIEEVSSSLAKNYVAYADDDEDIEEEPVSKVKITRRRFFRGIPRRA